MDMNLQYFLPTLEARLSCMSVQALQILKP